MGTKLNKIVNIIVESNLTISERIGIIQDLGIVKQHVKVDPIDTLNGYKKVKDLLESKIMDLFEIDFHNIVEDLFTEYNTEHGYKTIKPVILEIASPEEKGKRVVQGEGETEPEFQKRKGEAEKEQAQKEKDIDDANIGKKKGENKPLARALRSKGLSQNELAKKLDVNKSTISRLKLGDRDPSFELMTDLTRILGSADSLFPELRH